MASVVDAYGSAPGLGQPRSKIVKGAGAIEVSRYAVVQKHDIHREL
jgi:hypothetical protein